ncbi:hypothetical protein [Roseomonas sp. USHLN139]|uniref:hypothetical protein n=1 Tax=Roseomonas sp. USHLN139 TaxID=3081298 RepID=UPI003B020B5A
MPQLIIRSDHTIRVTAASATDDHRWVRSAVLTITATGRTIETVSPPCPDPQTALAEVVAAVRRQADIPAD